MLISFKNRKLEKVFNSQKLLLKEYGQVRAKKIMRRMAILTAAPTLSHVLYQPPERRHQLTGNREGQFAVDIQQNYRLIFEPVHDPLPLLEDGGIDLEKVTAIKILEVKDYHNE